MGYFSNIVITESVRMIFQNLFVNFFTSTQYRAYDLTIRQNITCWKDIPNLKLFWYSMIVANYMVTQSKGLQIGEFCLVMNIFLFSIKTNQIEVDHDLWGVSVVELWVGESAIWLVGISPTQSREGVMNESRWQLPRWQCSLGGSGP